MISACEPVAVPPSLLRRAVRAGLVLSGLVLGFWLLGLLLGSGHAKADELPKPPTTQSLTSAVQQESTGAVARLDSTVAAVTTQVRTTQVRSTVADVAATASTVQHSTRTVVQQTVAAVPAVVRKVSAPVTSKLQSVVAGVSAPASHPSASAPSPARAHGDGHVVARAARPSHDAVRSVPRTAFPDTASTAGTPVATGRPVANRFESSVLASAPAPAPTRGPIAPATPNPSTPSTVGLDGHDLGVATLPAYDVDVVTASAPTTSHELGAPGDHVFDPSFSPD